VEPQFFWHIIPSTERFIVVVVVIFYGVGVLGNGCCFGIVCRVF